MDNFKYVLDNFFSMDSHEETPGERAVKAELNYLKLKFEQEKRITGLRGDSKQFRDVDFYLPELDICIEFLGNWNTSKEHRQRYEEKKRVFKLNGIKCIWIYPNELTHTNKVIQEGLLEYNVKFRPKKQISTTKIKSPNRQNPTTGIVPKNNNSIKWFLVIGLCILILFFIFGNTNKDTQKKQGKNVNDLLYESLDKLYSDLSIGMSGKEFRTLIFNKRYQWDPPTSETKELNVFYDPDYVLKVYFDDIVQKEDTNSNCDAFGVDTNGKKSCLTSWVFTDAKLTKVEMYINNTKIKEK